MFKNLTPQDKKNLSSAKWRLENLYYISDKNSNKVLFKPNNIQRIINESKARHKDILKGRQFGVTTNEILKMFDAVCFNENYVACILAHERDSIEKIFKKVRQAYKWLAPELRPEIARGEGSKYEMFFPENNSKIYCDLDSRGDTINWLHISECAFIDDINRIRATTETVPIDTGIITRETTPNGMGNHFYDRWVDTSVEAEKFFFPWFFFPEYQIKCDNDIALTHEEIEFVRKVKSNFNITISKEQIIWRRFKRADLKELFIQEYPEDDITCFLSTGNTVLDLKNIKEHIDRVKGLSTSSRKEITVFHEVNTKHRYVIGADPAEGVGGDYSVAHVFNIDTMEQCATVRGHYRPYDFAHILNDLAKLYSPRNMSPLMVVERNNHGHAVLLELNENIGYSNIYRDKDDRHGWRSDRVSRSLLLDQFVEATDFNRIKINDIETLQECLTLVENKGKIEAAQGKHDDCIIATALCLHGILENRVSSIYNDLENKILL